MAWGRAVKARRAGGVAPLWLFTDDRRMQQVERAVAGLPVGLCGVVYRHDGEGPGARAALLRRVASICRARRLALVVAGGRAGAPAWVGRHWRAGAGGRRLGAGLVTSSAHGVAELVRAERAGADRIFLSPAFATESHVGARGLGPLRWAAMARRGRRPVFALGGITGATVRRLPRWVEGVGAIGALLP